MLLDNKIFAAGFLSGVGFSAALYLILRRFHPSSRVRTAILSARSSQSNLSLNDDYKLALIVRDDLKMTKGKVATQCSHATLAVFIQSIIKDPQLVEAWSSTGSKKVTLKVQNELEIQELRERAKLGGLQTYLVHDAGRTQVIANSATVLAIGPDLSSKLDQYTAHLKLY